jgi:hypothetical protein
MARLRRNEWNFASNAAELITRILRKPEFSESALGHAEAERTELRGAKRLDLVLFKRQNPDEPVVTGELKVPWDALGRTHTIQKSSKMPTQKRHGPALCISSPGTSAELLSGRLMIRGWLYPIESFTTKRSSLVL